jgi:hypothetical protein
MPESFYEVLGLERTASADQLKAAYRKQAIRWHPDKNPGDKTAEERFKLVAEAYSILSDSNRRQQYNALLDAGLAKQAYRATVDRETASRIFLREMTSLATELTFQNVPWGRIAPELVKRGCPEGVASGIAAAAETYRKASVRRAAVAALAQAVVWIVLGIIASTISYDIAQPGGHYFVTTGLFLVGGYNVLRALFYLATGRAPSPRSPRGRA